MRVNSFAISWYAALSCGKDGNYDIRALSKKSIIVRVISVIFRSAANMPVFVVIRGIRTPTVAGSSIIEGKGCDVILLV